VRIATVEGIRPFRAVGPSPVAADPLAGSSHDEAAHMKDIRVRTNPAPARARYSFVVAGALLLTLFGCASPRSALLGKMAMRCVPEDQPNKRERGRLVISSRAPLLRELGFAPKAPARPQQRRRTMLDPVLADLIADSSAAREVVVLVTFDERVVIPHFPSLVDSLPLKSPLNQARLRRAQELIASLRKQRASAYRAEEAALASLPGATIAERFWLAPIFAVKLPKETIEELLRQPHVVSIEAAVGRDEPPTCPPAGAAPDNNYTGDDVASALAVLRSEAYRGLGLPRGRVSLLDTGVWTEHVLLEDASFGLIGDCVNGGESCLDTSLPGFDPNDQCRDGRGHGTSSAAILIGTNALGSRWRGGLDVTLDSYQVFESGPCGVSGLCLNRLAAARAFQSATANLSRVIVANCVANGLEDVFATCSIAENAYLAGAVVVAANGDKGPGLGSVGAPATAPKVLGIGSRPLGALHLTEEVQSSGPAEGERLKPDVQATSWSETAQFDPDCPDHRNMLRELLGTSGATPYAGVAAALLRDWMKSVDPELEPGHVYAGMILSGRSHGTQIDNRQGAGLIQMPTNCCTWFGAEEVFEQTTREISIDLSAGGAERLEVALWWPENQIIGEPDDTPLQHNDVDLRILDPSGVVRATSMQVWSVFERATAPIGDRRGVWKIQIVGGDFWAHGRDGGFPSPEVVEPNHRQRVYWAAAARLPGEAPAP
jgi:hypothetical protein